ncbi:MAG: hypothetical protein SV760_10120, partial [Halobacteria archaeon]|nr:hypothetical protein [Halobacteria archaeon]
MVATHEHETERGARKAEAGVGASTWASAGVAGMLGGIGMGLVMQFVMGIMPVVGALYGSKGVATGWLAHLFHSLVFSLVFAAGVSFDPVKKHAGEFPESVGVGAGYGVVLWVFGGVFMFPIWLSSAGLPGPGVPAVNPVALGAHLVYGVVVGVTYPLILRNATKASDVAVTRRSMWISVGVSGLAAGVVMGLILQFVMKIMPAIGALYGVPGVVGGWLGHLFHSLVFAVVFGGLASLG